MNIRKITEDEVRSLWVQRLPDAPNRNGKFGTPGLTAAEVKAAYDALPLRIVECYNGLVDAVLRGEIASLILTGHEDGTLESFFGDVRSGALAEYLTVDGERSLTALAAAFDAHTHDGRYAGLVNGRLSSSVLPAELDNTLDGLHKDIARLEKSQSTSDAAEKLLINALEASIEALVLRENERDRRDAERDRLDAERDLLDAERDRLDAERDRLDAERDRLDAERDKRIAGCEENADAAKSTAEEAFRKARKLEGRVKNLAAATEGLAYEFSEISGKAKYRAVPSETLPMAAVKRLGGAAAGTNALPIPKVGLLKSADGAVYGEIEGDLLCQTTPAAGIDTFWENIRLALEPHATYSVAFDVYIDPSVAGEATFTLGCHRNEEGTFLWKRSFTVAERGTWVRRVYTMLAPPRETSMGSYADSGALMLAYSGKEILSGDGVRFRRISVDPGETAGEYRPIEGSTPAAVTAISVHGVNLLPSPYPHVNLPSMLAGAGVTITAEEDGSILLNGTAQRNVSYTLYSENDGLDLPEGRVYIDPLQANRVTMQLKIGASGDVWRNGLAQLSESDEFHGRYYVYIYVHKGASFVNERIRPFICLGNKAREAVPYHAPARYPIPNEVRALPGYGMADNYLDFEDGRYHAARGENGAWLAEEITLPFDDSFLPGGCLPVEAGGMIKFENEPQVAVDSSLLFELKKG